MTTPIDTSKYTTGQIINPDGTTSKKTSSSEMNSDDFMKLLIAQLKYQSPDNPTDSSQFMAQTAQFQQLSAIQDLAKQSAQVLNAQNSAAASSMIGKKIIANSTNGGSDITGVVTGVKLGTDGPKLKIGDMEVPLSSVKEVDVPK